MTQHCHCMKTSQLDRVNTQNHKVSKTLLFETLHFGGGLGNAAAAKSLQ